MFITKKKMALIVIVTLIVGFFLTIGGIFFALGLSGGKVAEVSRLFGVMRLIELRYVGDVSDEKLIDGAIAGMVSALDDPHSLYMDPALFDRLKAHTEGEFGGIGVTMGFKDGRVMIISVLEGTPGEAAGLRAGDEIIGVDDTPVAEIPADEVAMKIRGDAGTTVTLEIAREGEGSRSYTLTRANIHVDTAKGTMIEGTDVGYIRIASFSENTGAEFAEALDSLEQQGMKGLILDLRQNPGGLLVTCVDIANRLVPAGPIVSIVERDGSKEEYTSSLEAPIGPIVVLIDEHSASASEILAGALKDTGAATLVGKTSYGKGSVQMVLPLTHDDGIKLTVAKYYTPSGTSIDGTGIEPDVTVENEQPLGEGYDNQLSKALEIVRQKIAESEE